MSKAYTAWSAIKGPEMTKQFIKQSKNSYYNYIEQPQKMTSVKQDRHETNKPVTCTICDEFLLLHTSFFTEKKLYFERK